MRWLNHHRRLADTLLAVVLTIAGISGLYFDSATVDASVRPTNAFAMALVVIACMALAARRDQPAAVLAVSLVAVMARQGFGFIETADTVAVAIAAYSVGAHIEVRRRALTIAGATIGLLVTLNLSSAAIQQSAEPLGLLVGNMVFYGGAFLLGDNMRRRRVNIATLEERNRYLERERELLSINAVNAERARIARELHDVVAHSVSVIAVQAGGARRVIETHPETACTAIGVIETTARETLDELRRLLGVLRNDEAGEAFAPQPAISDLAHLIDAQPDLAIRHRIVGDPVAVPAHVDLSGYRIVQESLTNVRKHAGPHTTVDIEVHYLDGAGVSITIEDDGRGAAALKTLNGHGLRGMRERVELCGGDLSVGPRPGGGWRVRAVLPVQLVEP